MTKCVFCGKEEHEFKGTNIVGNDGVVRYYCSSKCIKNSKKLKRDKRKVRWAEAFHLTRDKARTKIEEIKEKEKYKAEVEKEEKKEDKSKKKSSKKN
jgi:large subunit ribosomal protein L24e